ncbi:Histone-like_transcription factor (CBF/NF-Y) [Hexamita inflata]|uniref:Histone-like transcription factor (CBF/NF-Y) n=1 Tax=Hexamita inflata TaxID=28002 RepID=A0AA86V8V7_9EUKA|nr:Histone-like transcription factor (CBF/NF-Y) [Hexamita inflata]CAI9959623.1 Histone-like transcription factor (CBF/NF-Y) [Hexamita inflata]CAI9968671.1 Histone-like transcription factor (CBF/NF-Y) [Hexamita inflata]CAI9972607.1 Histone-like transcription factor (CBF/NF-Y) [Hexamita inflata]
MERPYSLTLPLSKTKRISRLTNPAHSITPQATQLLTFTAEYVTKYILQEAEKEALKEGLKAINYSHIRKVVFRTPGLAYLEDTLPEKLILGDEEIQQ